MTLPADWDRTEEQRWRIYVVRAPNRYGRSAVRDLVCLATCASLTAIGTTLAVLAAEGQYDPRLEPVGILDGIEHVWLINPYANTTPAHV